MLAMLEHLPCVHIDPSPFGPQPIRSNMDKRDIRFELERQACQSLRQVLQLKLQQRRSREELVSQGIMPPLKGSAAFHEQRRNLERARTEDYLKRKIRSRPEKSELIRMHILEEPSAEPFLQAKQLQLKRVRLADDLNDRIAHRPGPMELIHKNILPVHSSIKQAFIETQFPRASGENSSFDEDSNDSLSPEQPRPVSEECSLGLGPLPSPRETLIGRGIPSPTQVPPPAPPLLSSSGSPTSIKLTSETGASSVLRTGANSHIKPQPKPNCDRSALRHKKTKDKPKIKKLKYHQYIPPDQKGDKEPPPHLDSSYAKILQQQQLFLQLQILSQQQQHYHTILPAPAKSQTAQQPSSSSKSMSTSSPAQPAAAPSTDFSNQCIHPCLSSVPVSGTKPVSLPPNLDEMKVAELKSELKLRSLPVSGTKNDLIERLRTYQELNGGSDTTSTPTAGGTTVPGAEGAGKSSKNTAIIVTGISATLNTGTPQQFRTCGGSLATLAVSLTPSRHSPAAMSPEDTSLNSDPLRDLMSSPLTHLSLQPSSAAQLLTHIKEEPRCSTPAPCQHSAKSASLQRCCSDSSDAPTTTSRAPVVSIDKDRLLQEKDKQIEELTRMLWQKQRLVEVLKMQLANGDRGKVPEPISVLGVKEEPLDEPDVALSMGSAQLPFQTLPLSKEMDVAKVIVKQEVIEAEEVEPEKTLQTPVPHGFLQPLTQMQEEQVAQQHTIHKVLVQQQQQQQQHNIQKQQHTIQNQNQMLENHNLQKPCQQRKKKSQKLQLMQKQLLQSQQQQQQSKHVQQMQLKQQLLLKQQKSVLQQQMKQQQTKQLQQIQIQTKIQLKQQQVLIQQKQQVQKQQQSSKVPQAHLKQQSGSNASFSLDHLKIDSTPTLVTDGNGNHFLIALSNHLTGNQITNPSEGKATNRITLQRLQSTPAKLAGQDPVQQTRAESKAKQSMQVKFLRQHARNGVLQVTVEKPQQGTAQCLSAPPSLQPFFKDQETAPSGKTTSSSSSNNEICPNLEVLFSPVSPASDKTAASSHDEKDTDHEDDFIDIILQKGETSFKTAPDPSLDCLHPDSSGSSPPPSPLHVLLSPPIPPSCDTPHLTPSLQPELRAPADTTEQKQHLGHAGSGRLEDFLESTTGKPLLGVEPGGLLTLIDDLHNQMLCTSSILDHPPSPMDTVAPWEQGLDNMDWLELTTEGDREAETPSLALQTPPSVFSTDFLDSSDLHIQWESCL